MYSNLRVERFKQGVSQYKLEKDSGIKQSVLSLYERGLRFPTEKHRKRIAKALGCNPDKLFSEDGEVL